LLKIINGRWMVIILLVLRAFFITKIRCFGVTIISCHCCLFSLVTQWEGS
jgi:hypothetical protein